MCGFYKYIGNSNGAVIPAPLLKELGLKAGDKLHVVAENGCIVMTPVTRPSYSLDELLAILEAIIKD